MGQESPPKRKARAVSGMSQEERQHKRDQDRRAQRALRERNKSHIQALDDELKLIRSANLEQAAAKDQVISHLREENHRLKAILAKIGSLVLAEDLENRRLSELHEDATGVNIDGGIAVGNPRDESPEARGTDGDSTVHIDADAEVVASLIPRSGGRLESRTPIMSISPTHLEHSSLHSSTPTVSSYDIRLSSMANKISGQDYYLDGAQSPSQQTVSHHSPTTAISSTESRSIGRHAAVGGIPAGVWLFLPRHIPSTCPLDQILLDFLSSRRLLAARGTSIETVLGPEDPLVAPIIKPHLATAVHPVSRVMAEVLLTFPNVEIPEKLSFMYLMHRTMRWHIEPTKENFSQLPQWLRPTPTQLTMPHAAWIDNIPWPGVRDILIEKSEIHPFQTFSELYSQNVTVNWPYEDLDAVVNTDAGAAEEMVLNPIFVKHIRKLSNWTVSRHFEGSVPEMIGQIYSRD